MLDSLSNSCLKIGVEEDDMLETMLKYCRATVFNVLVADTLNILAELSDYRTGRARLITRICPIQMQHSIVQIQIISSEVRIQQEFFCASILPSGF